MALISEPRNWRSAAPLVLKYGVFQWRVLQIFDMEPQAILFKTLPYSIFGVWLKVLAGEPR